MFMWQNLLLFTNLYASLSFFSCDINYDFAICFDSIINLFNSNLTSLFQNFSLSDSIEL